MQFSQIQEQMLYNFKLGHNATEATKEIYGAKREVAGDHTAQYLMVLEIFAQVAGTSTVVQPQA